jgi:hypothetical protein
VMINPLEYRGAYGGGADDRVEWRGRTGDSSVRPWGSVNLIEWASCGPHTTEEKSIVPPRWCRVLLHTLRRLGNQVPPWRGCRWWLRRRWSLLCEKACSFLPWLQHSPSQIYIRGFQLVTRYTNIILEYVLWVELGCDLLHETNGVDG